MENEIPSPSSGKKWLITAVVLLCVMLAALIIGLIYSNNSLNKKVSGLEGEIAILTKQNQDLQKTPDKTQTQTAAANIIYENKDYGFSLQLPLTWKEFKWSKRTVGWGSFGSSPTYDFGFAAQDSLFNIAILTHEQWNKISASDEGEKPAYLGENSQYVFAYSLSQYSANDFTTARRNEIKSIIATFAVN
jgi:hypothetical protein